MKKNSGTFSQIIKFADCVKIGIIFGSFLGFAEGLGLAIKIIKDNENSFFLQLALSNF